MTEEFETDLPDTTEDQMRSDEERLLDELGIFGESRRRFLGQASGAAFSVLACQILAEQKALAFSETQAAQPDISLQNTVKVAFKVNGAEKSLDVDSRMTLLDALRERLGLTGSKKGCDHGQCGACTVIVNGRRVLSCLTLAAQCEGKMLRPSRAWPKEAICILCRRRSSSMTVFNAAIARRDKFVRPLP